MTRKIQIFFELVKVGLFGHTDTTEKISWEGVDWGEVYRLAEEQAVVGLVAAGIENLNADLDLKVPQAVKLQFVGATLQIEKRNRAMNEFIAELLERMRKRGIYTLLVKGQGVAQCYEKPLWRASGDVDLLLNDENYEKAKKFLFPLSSGCKPERQYSKEWGLNIGSWYVELHGTQRTGLSSRVDRTIDEMQRDVLYGGRVRSWMNGQTQVFLPAADEDVFFVFTHFIKHFYKEGGVKVRQLCDWCRLLYTYKDAIDHRALELRLRKAGLTSEWKTFYNLASRYLGMPDLDSRLMVHDSRLDKKAEKIVDFILKGGEWRRWSDTYRVGQIFPKNTLRFLPGIILNVNWMKIRDRLFRA